MRIIIEAPDLSGKTTIIEALKNQIPAGVQIKLWTKPKDGSKESLEYIYGIYDKMFKATKDKDVNWIFDRYIYSQMAYSYKREHDDMDADELRLLDVKLEKDRALYVYVDVSIETLKARLASRGDEHITEDDLQILKDRYEEIWENTNITNKVRVPGDDLEKAIKLIQERLF